MYFFEIILQGLIEFENFLVRCHLRNLSLITFLIHMSAPVTQLSSSKSHSVQDRFAKESRSNSLGCHDDSRLRQYARTLVLRRYFSAAYGKNFLRHSIFHSCTRQANELWLREVRRRKLATTWGLNRCLSIRTGSNGSSVVHSHMQRDVWCWKGYIFNHQTSIDACLDRWYWLKLRVNLHLA